jgi:hypothetical protein
MSKAQIQKQIEDLQVRYELLFYKPAHMHIKPEQDRISLQISRLKKQLASEAA